MSATASSFLRRRGAPPLVSWHRGGGEVAPKATLAAFEAAFSRRAELVEVDVRRTADGVLVCVHDPTIDGLGAVDQLEFGALSEEQRASVLTYDAFLASLEGLNPSGETAIHLDLKGTGFEVASVEPLEALDRRFFVTTSAQSSIALLRRRDRSTEAFLTIGSSRVGLSNLERAWLRTTETLPYSAITGCDATGIAIHFHLLTTPLLRWCHRTGRTVVVWTVDRPRHLERFLTSEVDVVTTNRPMWALERRSVLSPRR